MKIQEMRQEFCVWTATSHHVAVMTQAAELKNIDEKLKYNDDDFEESQVPKATASRPRRDASASKNACYNHSI